MYFKVLLTLLLFHTTLSIVRIGNKRALNFKYNNNSTHFEYYTPNTNGWIAVGFLNANVSQVQKVVVFYNASFYLFNNFTKLGPKFELSAYHIEGFDGAEGIRLGQPHFHFILNFPKEEFAKYTHYYFYENTETYDISKPFNFNFSRAYKELDFLKTFDILSDRIEIYSKPWYYTTLALHFLCCLLPFIFGYFQPLRSRGVIPYLTIITISLGFLSEIRAFYYDLDSIFIECHVWGFFIIVTYDLCFVFPIIFYIRYFIIIHLKNLDQKYLFDETVVNGEKVRKIKRHIIILKYISHPLTSLFFVILYYLIHVVVMALILSTSKFECLDTTATAMDQAKSVMNLSFMALSFLIIVFDVIISYKKILRCQLKSYFIDEDPYFYRMELYQMIPVFLVILISEVVKIVQESLINRVIHSIAYYYVIYLFLFFPLIITIIKLPSYCKPQKKMDHNHILISIFNDQHMSQEFLEFTKKEWNQENALYYKDVIHRRKSKIWNIEEARKVFSLYLGSTSLFELNIPTEFRERLKKELENGDCSLDLFENINGVVIHNLVDSLNRFTQTKEFKKFIAGTELKDKMLN